MRNWLVLVLLLIASPAWAVTATIGNNTGDTYSGTDDTQLSQPNATTNYGGNAVIQIAKYAAGDHTHTIIKFTGLSSITGPVTVSSATIYLYNNALGAQVVVEARRLLRDWVEGQATWNIYSTGNSWTTAGGISDGNDRSATISATGTITDGAVGYHAITGSQLITDVQNMINGSVSNYGWHLSRQGVGEDSNYHEFASSEGTDTNRPYLSITYTVDSTGATGILRRRF